MNPSSSSPSLLNHQEIITKDYNQLLSLLDHSFPPKLNDETPVLVSSPQKRTSQPSSSPFPHPPPALAPSLDFLSFPPPSLLESPEIAPTLEDDDQVTALASMEQLILQHLHTSGLKKNKEQSLVHDFLNLKQLRKQILNKYFTRITQLSTENQRMQRWWHESLRNLIEKQQMTNENYEKQLQRISRDFTEENRRSKKELQSKYSKHLKELERKIALIQEKTCGRDGDEEREREMRRRIQELEEINEKLKDKNEKMAQRYKDNLRTLLDKEQRLEQSLHELRTTHHRSLEENSSLRNEATQSREELRRERAQSQELSHRHSLLEKKYLKLVEKYQHEKDESQHETESIRSNSDHVIREMKNSHEQELRMIDEKVRVALYSKDETIETLRRELQISNERYRQAEDLLESLNTNLIVR